MKAKNMKSFGWVVTVFVSLCLVSGVLEAAGFEIELSKSWRIGSNDRIHPIARSDDGGRIQTIFIPEQGKAWITKMDADFHNLWNTPVSPANIDFFVPASSGGYWIGIRNTEQVQGSPYPKFKSEFLGRIGPDGKGQPESGFALGQNEIDWCYGAIDVNDGVVISCWKNVPYKGVSTDKDSKILVPWLGKFDYKGRMAWEKVFSEDGNDLMYFPVDGDDKRHRLALTPDGDILFVVHVETTTIARQDGVATVDRNKMIGVQGRENILFKLDRDGNELARTKSDGASISPFIFSSTAGPILVESHVPAVRQSMNDSYRSQPYGLMFLTTGFYQLADSVVPEEGVRYTRFDNNLKVVKSKAFPSASLAAALMVTDGPEGGFYLAGCHRPAPDDTGSVGYLSADGETLEYKHLNFGKGHCGTAGLTSTADHSEATVYGQNNLTGELQTYRVRYTK